MMGEVPGATHRSESESNIPTPHPPPPLDSFFHGWHEGLTLAGYLFLPDPVFSGHFCLHPLHSHREHNHGASSPGWNTGKNPHRRVLRSGQDSPLEVRAEGPVLEPKPLTDTAGPCLLLEHPRGQPQGNRGPEATGPGGRKGGRSSVPRLVMTPGMPKLEPWSIGFWMMTTTWVLDADDTHPYTSSSILSSLSSPSCCHPLHSGSLQC
jgi:hypothetical protein